MKRHTEPASPYLDCCGNVTGAPSLRVIDEQPKATPLPFAMKRTLHLATASLALAVAFSLLNCPAYAGLKEGVEAYEAGNLSKAFEEFRAAAEKGDANCQFNLALMYEKGIGVAKDEKQAVVWYRKSAEQGNSNAQFNLGVLYENGRGCDVDFAQANQWYRKASVQGDALAIGNLGMLYLRGDGVKADKIAGLALLLQSATMDSSPENNARMNITRTKGLTPELVAAAQKLAEDLGKAKNLLIPLDEYLKTATPNTAGDSK
jgi:TPR repeat protein